MVLQTKTSVIIIFLACVLMVSCNKGNSGMSAISVNPDEIPRVHTENSYSLISDSGITRYRLQAKVWDIFEADTGNYWYFPKGIYIEQYDSLFNVQVYVKADTGYNYQTRSLWRGIGNVFIKNMDGLTVETSELFLDNNPISPNHAIFTDKYVKVTTPEGRIVTGVGMHSDISMSNYVFYQTGAEFEVQEESPRDTINLKNDSIIPLLSDTAVFSPLTKEESVSTVEKQLEKNE